MGKGKQGGEKKMKASKMQVEAAGLPSPAIQSADLSKPCGTLASATEQQLGSNLGMTT